MKDKILKLPKVELHLHLDGAVSLELASKLSGLDIEVLKEKMIAPSKCENLSEYFFYKENDKVIAYLRAFYKDDNKDIIKIGRVLTLKHNQGLGRKLLTESLPQIIKIMKPKKLTMDAQKYAIGFYQKFGFSVVSDEFIEEEILHVIMELDV